MLEIEDTLLVLLLRGVPFTKLWLTTGALMVSVTAVHKPYTLKNNKVVQQSFTSNNGQSKYNKVWNI